MVTALILPGPDALGHSWMVYGYLLAHGSLGIACLGMAGLLYLHRYQVAEAIRPLMLWLAAFMASLAIAQGDSIWRLWHSHSGLSGVWLGVMTLLGLITAWQMRGTLPRLVMIPQDPEDVREVREQDLLTGIANPLGLERAFERLVSHYASDNLRHSLLRLELDGLERFSQSYGQAGGDALRLTVAQLLCDRTRSLDIVARVSDNGFALLLKGCSLDRAMTIAEHLCDAIALVAPPGFREADLPLVTGYIGITEVFPGLTFETCYAQAELALRQSQQTGHQRVTSVNHIYQPYPVGTDSLQTRFSL